MILLVADVQDLKANPNGPAQRRDHRGADGSKPAAPTATVLVQEGTLKVGDIIVAGTLSGKVRAMFDDTGKRIKKAPPATPVSILGLPEVPAAGDRLRWSPTRRRRARWCTSAGARRTTRRTQSVTLDTLYTQMREGKVKELNLLVKADVQGSAEALKHALSQLATTDALKVRLIHDGVGNVSETDVHLAAARRRSSSRSTSRWTRPAQRVAADERRGHPLLRRHLQAGGRHRGGAQGPAGAGLQGAGGRPRRGDADSSRPGGRRSSAAAA